MASQRLEWSGDWFGGNNTCKTFDHNFAEGATVRFQACENINNDFDDCSEWKNTTA